MGLDLEIQQTVVKKPRQRLFASHPIYHYLARRYELHIEDIVGEPDEGALPGRLDAVGKTAAHGDRAATRQYGNRHCRF